MFVRANARLYGLAPGEIAEVPESRKYLDAVASGHLSRLPDPENGSEDESEDDLPSVLTAPPIEEPLLDEPSESSEPSEDDDEPEPSEDY